MSAPVTNSQRARDFVDDLPVQHCWCSGVDGRVVRRCRTCEAVAESIERMLNEASDRGREEAEAPTADADTKNALVDMVREMLAGLADSGTGLRALLDAKADDIVQLVIANFRIQLMDEGDELPSVPPEAFFTADAVDHNKRATPQPGTPEQVRQNAYGRWKAGTYADDEDRSKAFEEGCDCHYLEGDFHHGLRCAREKTDPINAPRES